MQIYSVSWNMSLKKYKDVLVKPLIDENPITLQILGICSALAVTNNLSVTMVMCVALTSVVPNVARYAFQYPANETFH